MRRAHRRRLINRTSQISLIPGSQAKGNEASKRALRAKNWMSINEDTEFLPLLNGPLLGRNNRAASENTATNNGNKKKMTPAADAAATTRSLEGSDSATTGSHSDSDPYSVQPFVSGIGDYDENQQAWRLLGFMIDCNEVSEYNDDYVASNGSGDEGATDEGCARYLLWAAYVDLNYEGCGIGEYQYWNHDNEEWDDTSCQYADDDCSRCAKMDCHLEDTHFSVLGFFKHKNYDDWMEQLFKHQGMCVWSTEQYAFMKNARKAWPGGCVSTGKTADNGDYLYYNIRPAQNGRIAVGLYTDLYCLEEYPADTDTIEDIVGNIFQDADGSGSGDNYNYDFSGDTFEESMARWDAYFGIWNTCHPCVSYDLENTDGSKYMGNGYGCYDDDYNNYNYNNNGRQLGGEGCGDGEKFECYDDAGYTNVNQVRIGYI